MTYLLAFVASFIFVAIKAFQQLNVVHYQYLAIVPTSISMAVAEVFITVCIVQSGWGPIVLPIGIGGGLGCILSMYLHRKLGFNGKTVTQS